MKVRFERRQFFLADVGRIADNDIEAEKTAGIVEHFGKLEAPFEGIAVEGAGFVGFELLFHFGDFGAEFFGFFFDGGFVFLGIAEEVEVVVEQNELAAEFGEFFGEGIAVENRLAEFVFDALDEGAELFFAVFVAGFLIGLDGKEIIVAAEFLFAEYIRQVFIEGKAADEGIAGFDVDIDVGEGL